jgi:competence protein ComEC
MLLGDEVNFDAGTRGLYQDTGIVHIVSISGSHVAFFFVLINGALFWLYRRRQLWVKYSIALVLIAIYVLVAGAPVPAVRSALMFGMVAAGMLMERDGNPVNILLGSALLMLIWQPMWIYSLGFQLSFLAVLSLALFFRRIAGLWAPPNRVLKGAWQVIAVSVSVQILTVPVVIYYFHLFPVGFLVANALASLIMSVVMVLGMLILAFSGLPVVATALSKLTIFITEVFSSMLGYLQKLNPEALRHLYLSPAGLWLSLLAISCYAVWLIQKQAKWLLAGLGSTVVLLSMLIAGQWEALHQHRLIIYNTSGSGFAAQLIGKRSFVMTAPDYVADTPNLNFATSGAENRYLAWRRINRPEAMVHSLSIDRKLVLILHKALLPPLPLAVKPDYLVADYPVGKPDVRLLKEQYGFDTLVTTGKQKRWRAAQWRDSCLAAHIPVHIVQDDGAFTLHAD